MLTTIFGRIFGCSHNRTTFPLTMSRRCEHAGARKRTYVVCLGCGKEFNYNWKEMRIDRSVEQLPAARIVTQPEQIITN